MLPASPKRDEPAGKVVGEHTKTTGVTDVTGAGSPARPGEDSGSPLRAQDADGP
jgi:hypothetical protein